MTDEPPTQLEPVIVTGQRVRAPSPFAGMQFPTITSSAPHQQQLEPADESPPEGQSDKQQQCAMPEGRRQWNADAKAKEAEAAFREKARSFNEADLQNREFGALICEFSSGQIALGPIEAGDPILDSNGNAISYPGGLPTVPIAPGGCGSGTPIGYVHSHPGLGTGIPSNPDFAFAKHLKDYYGAPDNVGIYVVSQYQDSQTGAYKTGVGRASLSDETAANQGTLEPEWVNPEATPCPGDS